MPPNILLITTDQQRRDSMGCYGNPICQTPNLDALAGGGLRFTECYVNNPLCMPNRSTLLTGRHVNAHRVRTNGRALDPREVTFPQLLSAAGYRTGGFGKMHFTSVQPNEPPAWYERPEWWEASDGCIREGFFGFDEVAVGCFHGGKGFSHLTQWQQDNHPDTWQRWSKEHALRTSPHNTPEAWHSAQPVEAHPNRFVTEKTVEFLKRNTGGPFFCWASYPDPHHPYNPPEPYASMYDPADAILGPRLEGELDNKPPHVRQQVNGEIATGGTAKRPTFTEEQLREVFALTYGMVSFLDDEIGRVLATLDELNLAGETLVIFTTDHGDLMGDHFLFNKGPFNYQSLVQVPLILRWPGRITAGCTTEGIVQTIDIAGTILDAAGVEPHVGMQSRSFLDLAEGRAYKHRDAALVDNYEEYLELNVKTVVSRGFKLTRYCDRPYGELYDLENDPGEFTNLYDEPNYRRVRMELTERMVDLEAATEDPLPPRTGHA